MTQLATADISDRLHPEVQYVEAIYHTYGALINFSGQIETLKCFEDNSLVREVLDTYGENKVLVVDAGGSKRCAMLGDQDGIIVIKEEIKC
jgi:regulator of ribonuclease activity A